MSDYDKEMQRVIKQSAEQGWRHSMTTRGHHQFYGPDHHTIVVTGGTPSDYRSWANFMADMKRAGYTHELTHSLGDALRAANGQTAVVATPAGPPAGARGAGDKRVKSGVVDALRVLMAKHPAGLSFGEITAVLRSQLPNLTPSKIGTALADGKKRGRYFSPERGFWRAAEPPKAVAPAAGLPPGDSGGGQTAEGQTAGGATSGDPEIDGDLRALDEALAALGRIETVVRRHRDVLHKMAELKKLLKGIGQF